MSTADLTLPLWGLLGLSLVMLAAWARQLRTRNAGPVDLIWAGGLGALAVLYAALAEGWWPRRALVGLLAGLWSARLSLHLLRRIRSEPEDGRYAKLRADLGPRFGRWTLIFFQAQAVLAVLLSLVFLVPSAATEAGWRAQDAVAILIWVVAVGGESLADRQLRTWRADPRNAGRTCRTGLWRYSRHPNYFFEWVHWLVYPVLSLGLPWGWTLWAAPALMLFLVVRVTGIPPTEQRALASRGDDYRAYQRSTNAFFPGPPRVDPTPVGMPSRDSVVRS